MTLPAQNSVDIGHMPTSAFPLSRRSLVRGGILMVSGLLGLGSGMATGVAPYVFRRQQSVSARPFTPSVYRVFAQHQQTVQAISWAPDEHAIVSGGDDQRALLWNMQGQVLQKLSFPASVRALAWSPDGEQIAVGSGNVLAFFDAKTNARLSTQIEPHTAPITGLVWDGGLAVSAGADRKAIVWNGQTHQPQLVFRHHTTALEALAVLHDTVATASQGGLVRLWNIFSGQELHGYYAPSPQRLNTIAFSPSGSLAVGSDDGNVYVWSDGRVCASQTLDTFGIHCRDAPLRLQGHRGPVRAIAYSSNGTLLATGGEDARLLLWSLQTQKPGFTQALQKPLAALAWSPSGHFLAGACGAQVIIWRM